MVDEFQEIRDDLDAEVFNVYGKSVTLLNKSQSIYNTRGEELDSTETSSTITIVPYNQNLTLSQQEFGDSEEEVFEAAVRYDTVIKIDDIIEMESIRYRITGINTNYLPENVAYIITAVKEEP